MKFDWYSATIGEKPEAAAKTIAEGLRGVLEKTRGLYGYTNGFQVHSGGSVVARILCGGVNIWPHAWASGENTVPFVDVVRSAWPDNHHVTRLDSCEDLQGDATTWDRLYSVCTSVADDQGLTVRHDGDYHRRERGRTLYIGSPKSPCSVRLYEKGKQLRTQNPATAHEYPENWIRIEAQIRPDKEIRETAAGCSPSDAWGFSNSTRAIALGCLGLDAEKINAARWKKSSDQKALEHMAKQYRNLLTRFRLANPDGWAGVGMKIGKTIEIIEAGVKSKEDSQPFN